jgi:transcriptional regulator with XRE-family HTH domain
MAHGRGARERTDYAAEVAAQTRMERAYSRLTIAQMVERAGIAKSTYQRLEAGERTPDLAQLQRIAAAHGLTPAQFLGRVEERLDCTDRP